MKRQTFAETVADIVIGPERSDMLVPRGNMMKKGFSRGFSCGMVTAANLELYTIVHFAVAKYIFQIRYTMIINICTKA